VLSLLCGSRCTNPLIREQPEGTQIASCHVVVSPAHWLLCPGSRKLIAVSLDAEGSRLKDLKVVSKPSTVTCFLQQTFV
jgi:hypothetical protein